MTQQPQDPASPAAPASGPASGADPATTTSAPRTPDWSIDATADEKSTPRTAGADMTAAELAAAGRDFMPASPHDQPFTTSERKANERGEGGPCCEVAQIEKEFVGCGVLAPHRGDHRLGNALHRSDDQGSDDLDKSPGTCKQTGRSGLSEQAEGHRRSLRDDERHRA